jgi:alpha-glucosidase
VLFEDDGESWGYQQGNALWLNWKMRSDAEAIHLNFQRKGSFQPAWQTLKIMLPPGEQRQLFIDGVAVDKAQAEAVLADIAAE